MSLISRVIIATAFTLSVAAPASAGIADSPLPVLVAGKKTELLYSVPGVVRGGNLGTFFVCTSTDTATQRVGIETFSSAGGSPLNDAAAQSLSVAPGATARFGTTQPINDILGGNGLSSQISSQGGVSSARILSTSKKLACTVFVGDAFNIPPATSWQLTIIAKTKQKAAN